MFGLFGKVTDPVCGMKIDKKEARLDSARQAKFSKEIDSQKYYFCSQNCQDKFDADPKKYTNKEDHVGGCCH